MVENVTKIKSGTTISINVSVKIMKNIIRVKKIIFEILVQL